VGFGGDGWPLVRPEAVDEQSKHAGRAVIAAQLAVDFKAPLMRGQRVLLQLAAAISESQQVQCRELATSVQTENTAPSSSLAEESSQEAWILVSILAATSGPEKRRCIHPTRVASLCNNCPRRKGSGSRGMQLRSCSGAVEKEQRWARGLEVLECIRVRDEDLALELLVGADLSATDHFGSTPLILAARAGLESLCKELLSRQDIDLNAQNHFGSSALICASTNGHLEICEQLLRQGAATELRTRLNVTALGKAAAAGHREVCHRLLASGAAVDVKTKLGQTVSELASQAGHTDLASLLSATSNGH